LTLLNQSLPAQENKGLELEKALALFHGFFRSTRACPPDESAAESAFAVLYFEQENV